MADNRKTLESIPVPASGATPDPLTTTEVATDGTSVGGIPRTADSALGASIGLTGDTPAIGPNTSGSDSAPQASQRGGTAGGASTPATTRHSPGAATDKPQDDGPLDSLGKAIIAPITGSEQEAPPRR